MKMCITEKNLIEYQEYLYEEEKSPATISKYMCDLQKLVDFLEGRELTKKEIIEYKEMLKNSKKYQINSINSFLAASNNFFEYMGWHELKVKTFRIQKNAFLPDSKNLTKQEYRRLVRTAERKGQGRLALILETICATGIRISELPEITVSCVKKGTADIYCKGKARQILIPRKLQKKLLYYIQKNNIKHGAVFQTSSGHAVDRSNIWKEMKALCEDAGVEKEKVFPHNLRHLFAKSFYQIEKDIAKLADVLGHSNIETTRIYIKTSGYEHRKQLESMGLVLEMQRNTT